MKNFVTIWISCIVILVTLNTLNAQTALQYGRYDAATNTFSAPTTFAIGDITSDFGVRNAGPDATIFHRGTDIVPRGEQNIVLYTPFAGTIAELGVRNGIVYLNLQSNVNATLRLGFLHLFSNDGDAPQVSNGFKWVTLTNTQSYVIIDLVNNIAYAEAAGENYTDPITNITYTTRNTFGANTPIAPMGNSGADGRYHLHLTQYENQENNFNSHINCIDPLRDMNTAVAPDHNLNINLRRRNFTPNVNLNCNTNCEENGNYGQWNAFVPTYNAETRNIVQVQIVLPDAAHPDGINDRYTNAYMHESEIKVTLRDQITNTENTLRGAYHFAKFQIDPRGNTVIEPTGLSWGNLNPEGMGCFPYAYTTGVGLQPYDFYVMPDFYTRLAKTHTLGEAAVFAQYPWDAYYSDGGYDMRGYVNTIRNNAYTATPYISMKIDNFKPYIHGVQAYFSNSAQAPVYERFWTVTGNGNIRLDNTRTVGVNDPQNPGLLSIYALFSEEMQSARARIPGPYPNWVNGSRVEKLPNGLVKWQFQMGVSGQIIANQCYRIEFEGTDVSGNQLLAFELPASCTQLPLNKNIPVHTGTNTWSNNHAQGQDKVHFFRLNGCGRNNDPVECIAANEVQSQVYYSLANQSTGGIDITILGEHPTAAFTWTDVNGNVISNTQNLKDVPAGIYCLEVKEDCCTVSNCFEVGECSIGISANVTHPILGQGNGGIILTITQANEPVSYLWNTGANTPELSGLSAGTYSVTVSDQYACSLTASWELIDCPEITVTATVLSQAPACNEANGGFRVLQQIASGGIGPYTFEWYGPDGQALGASPSASYGDLAAGDYTLIATDVNGCKGSYIKSLLSEYYPDLTADIIGTCEDAYTGVISLFAQSGQPTSYTFTWDDGVVHEGVNLSLREALSAGSYCVTITPDAAPDCIIEKCYEVEAFEVTQALEVSNYTVTQPCINELNGDIQLTVNGGVPPYTINWSDTPLASGPERSNVGAGSYTATVWDACQNYVEITVNLTPISLVGNFGITPGCSGQGSIVAPAASNGTPPYSLVWNTGATSNQVNQLRSGRYGITFTDARGCTVSGIANLQNKEYHTELTNACEGQPDGAIKFTIFNPLGEDVVGIFNNQPFINAENAPISIEALINNLVDGAYTFSVLVGGCVYSNQEVEISKVPITNVYDYFDGKYCYYKNQCKGVDIPNSQTVFSPTIRAHQASDGFLSACKAPIYCGNNKVGYKKYKYEEVTVAEYRVILQNSAHIIGDAQSRNLLDMLIRSKLPDCQRVLYCPATMEIIATYFTLDVWSDAVESSIPGCYYLDCEFEIGNNNFCEGDILPDIFDDFESHGGVIEECIPVTVNLYQLILWKDQLIAKFPGFSSTELYNEWVIPFQNDPRAKCANITFCQSQERQFDVIFAPIMENINCDQGEDDCSVVLEEDGCSLITCVDYTSSGIVGFTTSLLGTVEPVPGYFEKVCQDFDGTFYLTNNEDEKYLVSQAMGFDLNPFSYITLDGRVTPKGVIKHDSLSYIMDYHPQYVYDVTTELGNNIEQVISNWNTEQILYSKKLSINRYSFGINHPDTTWEISLNSSLLLKLNSFSQQDSFVQLGGTFTGTLWLGDVMIGQTNGNGAFFIRLDGYGQLISSNILSDVADGGIQFTNHNDAMVVSVMAAPTTKLDGNVLGAVSGSMLELRLDNDSPTNVSNSGFEVPAGMKLTKSLYDKVSGKRVYVFFGSGLLKRQQGLLLSAVVPSWYIVEIGASGNIIGSKLLDANNIDPLKADFTLDADAHVVAGITFSNSINLNNNIIQSNGGKDVVMLRLVDDSWQVLEHYGSSDDEFVQQLHSEGDYLFWGGYFAGATLSRKMGKHTFKMSQPSISAPYIAYVRYSELQSKNQRKDSAVSKVVKTAKEPNIFPNPHTQQLFLSVPEPGRYELNVCNNIGSVVLNQTYRIENTIVIPESEHFPAGVYYYTITEISTGNRKVIKVVKM